MDNNSKELLSKYLWYQAVCTECLRGKEANVLLHSLSLLLLYTAITKSAALWYRTGFMDCLTFAISLFILQKCNTSRSFASVAFQKLSSLCIQSSIVPVKPRQLVWNLNNCMVIQFYTKKELTVKPAAMLSWLQQQQSLHSLGQSYIVGEYKFFFVFVPARLRRKCFQTKRFSFSKADGESSK